MNYPLVLWRGECIPVLSFPDASDSTPVKSTRGEFSSPPDSVMIRLKILLGRLAALAGPVNKMWIPSPLTDENQVGAGDKDAGLCNNEPGKYPEWRRRGGRAAAAAMWRLHGDEETRGWESTEQPRRDSGALPSAEAFCSLLPLCSSSPCSQDPLTRGRKPLETGARLCG